VVENGLRNDVMRLRVSVVESCGELSIPGKTKTGVTASKSTVIEMKILLWMVREIFDMIVINMSCIYSFNSLR
jgi:hypothetical protein